jgi:hypothetical protein
VQRHNGKKKTKRDGYWEAQTLKDEQNPSGWNPRRWNHGVYGRFCFAGWSNLV